MKIKRILMPLMALVIMAGQLTGCGNSGAKELQDKLSKGEEIVIEAEAKNGNVKGEPCEIDWIELAKKTSNADSRKAIDKYFSNYEIDGSKIGSFYLNADCKQESNNTILTVLGNQFVADLLKNNADIMGEISQYLNKDYADLEESDYLSAMFNAYFELIPDSIPNYFNGGVSLTRAEAMALVRLNNKLQSNYKQILLPLQISLQDLKLRQFSGNSNVMEIHKEIAKLKEQTHVLARLKTKGFLDNTKFLEQTTELTAKINKLQSELKKITHLDDEDETLDQIEMLIDYFEKQDAPISEFDESAFEFLINKIVVTSQNELEFHVMGGLKFKEKIF